MLLEVPYSRNITHNSYNEISFHEYNSYKQSFIFYNLFSLPKFKHPEGIKSTEFSKTPSSFLRIFLKSWRYISGFLQALSVAHSLHSARVGSSWQTVRSLRYPTQKLQLSSPWEFSVSYVEFQFFEIIFSFSGFSLFILFHSVIYQLLKSNFDY